MKGIMLYRPSNLRFEQRPEPSKIELTGAIIRLARSCIRSDHAKHSAENEA